MQHLQLICRSHLGYKLSPDRRESLAGVLAEGLRHPTPEPCMRLSVPIRFPSIARYNQCMQIKTTAELKKKAKIREKQTLRRNPFGKIHRNPCF